MSTHYKDRRMAGHAVDRALLALSLGVTWTHGSVKNRIRPMAGLDTMDWTAALKKGRRVLYNLVRTHHSLGITPGQAAGLPNFGGFRWRAILDFAVRQNVTAQGEEAATTD